jgi:hypothetical protein
MFKKIALIASIFLLLSGCVTNPAIKYSEDINIYVAENRPKALGGSMQWSKFYEGALAIAQQIPPNVTGRSVPISHWLEALNMAKEYEAGRMTKEAFFKWREEGNAKAEAQNVAAQRNRAQCEYEAKAGAAAVRDTGRSGLNFDQIYKERELFELCMKAKQ